MNGQSAPGTADIGAIYQRLGQGLVDTAQPGWASIELRATIVDATSDVGHWASGADGARVACTPLTPDTLAALEDLRSAFYQEGKGAWLSMTCSISASGQIAIDVNYDDEPGWEAFVAPSAYARDLVRFPRDPENIPRWMRDKLAQAGA